MSLFFFHTQTTTRFTDEHGFEFATPREARQQAIKTCGEMVHDCPDEFWGSRPWGVTVTDATGLILWELSIDGFSSAGAPKE
ncbi:MAG: hypothetical protein V4530_11490 [Pseudomonadota bacterium]